MPALCTRLAVVEAVQQLSRDFASAYAKETQDPEAAFANVGRSRACVAPATSAQPTTLPPDDPCHGGGAYSWKRLAVALLLEFASLDDSSQRLVQLSDCVSQAEGILPQCLSFRDLLSADRLSPCKAEDSFAGMRPGVSPVGTAESSSGHSAGSGTGAAFQKKKKAASAATTGDAIKDATIPKEMGAGGHGRLLQSPGVADNGNSVQFSLLDQCLTAAAGMLCDIMSGTDKINKLVEWVPAAEDASSNVAAGVQSAALDGLSRKGGSKKGRSSYHTATSGNAEIASASLCLNATLAAVKAAQRACMELPETVHVELFLLCFRFRSLLGDKFQRLCRALEVRLRYRHFLNPPLVDLSVVSSSLSETQTRPGSVASSPSNEAESPPWTVLSCDLRTFKRAALPAGGPGSTPSPSGTYLVGQRWDWERVLRSVASRCQHPGERDEDVLVAEKQEIIRRELDSVALICDLRPVWAASKEEAKKLYRKGRTGPADMEADRSSGPVDVAAELLSTVLEFHGPPPLSETVADFRENILNEIDSGLIPSEQASLVALEIPLRKACDRNDSDTLTSPKPIQNLFFVYLQCSGSACQFRGGGSSSRAVERNIEQAGGVFGEKPADTLEALGRSPGKTDSETGGERNVSSARGEVQSLRRMTEGTIWWTEIVKNKAGIPGCSLAHALLQPTKDLVLVASKLPFSHPTSPKFSLLLHPDLRLTPPELQVERKQLHRTWR
ncbi:hypothetical protein TGRUB_210460 [Toxoplasma gondii RUB]|uniref:Uncharacterized protein n=1 Tax=Toxoplasma gondii RUB TaxID=935652 RepID=A0A086M228_TOXGO|nr:hypothetical protein TGRUB_210460 [Toxoplasma gondii RUB]